ncbi:MAG: hypothetical protein ACO3N7_05690 [Kiritimatiellia bacterium]
MNSFWAVVHFFCAAYMTGIIWFVQRVQYPMLHLTDGPRAKEGHREYTRRMGPVVMPVMLLEVFLQGRWLVQEPGLPAFVGAALLATVWLSTFLLQVPCHRRLERNFDPQVQKFLVRSNWIRSAAWSLRALITGLTLLPCS